VVNEDDEAAALVVEALVALPGFEWDDREVTDCAHVAVQALKAAGWGPRPGTKTKGQRT
jgi:hypothetical protein